MQPTSVPPPPKGSDRWIKQRRWRRLTLIQRCILVSLFVHLLLLFLLGLIVVSEKLGITAEKAQNVKFVASRSPQQEALEQRLRNPFSKAESAEEQVESQRRDAPSQQRRAAAQSAAAPPRRAEATSQAQTPSSQRQLTAPSESVMTAAAPQLSGPQEQRIHQEQTPAAEPTGALAERRERTTPSRSARDVTLPSEAAQMQASSMASAPSAAREMTVETSQATAASQPIDAQVPQSQRIAQAESEPAQATTPTSSRTSRAAEARPQTIESQTTPTQAAASSLARAAESTRRAGPVEVMRQSEPTAQPVTVETQTARRLAQSESQQAQASQPMQASRRAQANTTSQVDIQVDAPAAQQRRQSMASQTTQSQRATEAIEPAAQTETRAARPAVETSSVAPLAAAAEADLPSNAPSRIDSRLAQTQQAGEAQSVELDAVASSAAKQTMASSPAAASRRAAVRTSSLDMAAQTSAANVEAQIAGGIASAESTLRGAAAAPSASRMSQAVSGEAMNVSQAVAAATASRATQVRTLQTSARTPGSLANNASTRAMAQRVTASGATIETSAAGAVTGTETEPTVAAVAGASRRGTASRGAATIEMAATGESRAATAVTDMLAAARSAPATLSRTSVAAKGAAPTIGFGSTATQSMSSSMASQLSGDLSGMASARRRSRGGRSGPGAMDVGRAPRGAASLASAMSHSVSVDLGIAGPGVMGMSPSIAPVLETRGTGHVEIEIEGPRKVYLGRVATYALNVTNTGDGDATDTVVEDTPPTGVSVMSISDGGQREGDKIIWRLGTLKPSESRKLEVQVRGDQPAELSNRASVSAAGMEPVEAQKAIEVFGIPAILLEVGDADDDDPAQVGQAVRYTIVASNQGTIAGRDIVIRCMLEDEQAYVAADGATPAKVLDQVIQFEPLASLKPGGKASWQVTIRAAKPGDVRFRVEMTEAQLTRPVSETEATTQYE